MYNHPTFKVINLKCLIVSGRKEIRSKLAVSISIVLEPSNCAWHMLK